MTEWERLKAEWQNARAAADSAQLEMDNAFELHLQSGAPMHSKRMQEMVDDLYCQEAEARGRMDQFINEHC